MKDQVGKLLENLDDSSEFIVSVTVINESGNGTKTNCVVNNWPTEMIDHARSQISNVLFDIKVDHEEDQAAIQDPDLGDMNREAFSLW